MPHQNPYQILTGTGTDPPDPDSQPPQPPKTRPNASDASQGESAEKTLRLALLQAAREKDEAGYVRIPALMLTAMAAMIQILEDTKESLQDTKDLLRQVMSTRGPNAPTSQAHLPPKPMSWAAAAAAKPQQPSVTRTQAPAPPPSNSFINQFKPSQVVIRAMKDKKPFSGLTANTIVERVNVALEKVKAVIDEQPVKVKAAHLLPSGDIKFYTATRKMARWLLENRVSWSQLADPDLITQPTKHPVLLHAVPANAGVTSGVFQARLLDQNSLPSGSILDTRWLKDPKDTLKSHGTVVMNLADKQLMLRVEQCGVFHESHLLRATHYEKSPVQCFKCLELGHVAKRCRNSIPTCAICSDPHETEECMAHDVPTRCARCIHQDLKTIGPDVNRSDVKYAHSPKSRGFPLRFTRETVIHHQHSLPNES